MKHRPSRCLTRSKSGRIILPVALLATCGVAVQGFSSASAATSTPALAGATPILHVAQDDAKVVAKDAGSTQDDSKQADAKKPRVFL